MSPQKPEEQKKRNVQLAKQEISKHSLKTFHLASLIAILPAYLASRIVPDNYSYNIRLIIVLVVFFVAMQTITFFIRKWLRNNPNSPWSNLVD